MNPLRKAERDALFWRTAFLLTVPPLFLLVVALTHYAHQHQGEIRQRVAVELQR